jgi:hypothetical protein
MNRMFRTLLLWLLIAVLPLHAVAAAIGMPCSNMQGKAPVVAAEHRSDAAVVSAHHASQDHHGADAADSADEDAGAHATCGACSAFCSAPPVPATAHISVPDYDGSEALVAAPVTLAAGFIPEGPRRPPRAHSV